MNSSPILAALLAACLAPAPTPAKQPDKDPSYLVFVTASEVTAADANQEAQIQIETKIIQYKGDGKTPPPTTPAQAKRNPNASVLSAPRVLMLDGSRAHIMVGNEGPDVPGKPKVPRPGGLYEGVRVDIIKPLHQPAVLVVTTVMKEGKVVFADAQTVPVKSKAEAPAKTAPVKRR